MENIKGIAQAGLVTKSQLKISLGFQVSFLSGEEQEVPEAMLAFLAWLSINNILPKGQKNQMTINLLCY